ncbi:MAG: MarR family transcriptional regulator [bacterium]|nr:MarR family transcriptional regulator [bacterium]
MKDPADSVQHGLVARLRTLLLALDRQDRLETAQEFVGWLAEQKERQELAEHASELLLRAFRVAGDPVNFRILTKLDRIDPVGIADLMRETRLSRVAVSERINDMVQTGLAVREMVNDHVRGTELTEGLTAFVNDTAQQAGIELKDGLGGGEPHRGRIGGSS